MTTRPRVMVAATLEDAAQVAAGLVVECGRAAVERRGRFHVALSGGETPRALYRVLAQGADAHGYRERMPWSAVEVFWGDERAVPPDHEQSNYRMAREALLDHVPVVAAHVHRIAGELPPEQAAMRYDAALREAPPPAFDLLLLGLGADAHTASLFPATTALEEAHRWVVAHFVHQVQSWRITVTAPVIAAAGSVLVLVAGAGKAVAVARVLEGEEPVRDVPAKLIAANSSVTWVLDRAAASRLTHTEVLEARADEH